MPSFRHRTFWDRSWLAAAAWIVLSGGVVYVRAAETVTVTLNDGKSFTAKVDQRTSDRELWLRFEYSDSLVVVRPIAWDRVHSALINGQSRSAEQFRQQADGLKSAGAATRPARPVKPVEQAPEEPDFNTVASGRVASLSVEATVANWDADVEVDGLVVRVYPLDSSGQVVAADGTLEIELIGEGPQSGIYSQTFPMLGRWTRMLTARDVTVTGAVYRLPFQRAHPEFDLQIGSAGLLQVRLAVPGQGLVEATSSTVTIRPINPVRDRVQQNQRTSRFLPGELTGQGPTK